MNLKVSHRIIGGFAVVIALIFVLGFSSLSNLQSIGGSSNDLSKSAIPTLVIVNKLKLRLIQIQNLIITTKTEQEKSQLAGISNQLKADEENLNELLQQLKRLDVAYMSSQINEVESVFNDYFATVNAAHEGKMSLLNFRANIEAKSEDFEDLADDISTLILDYSEDDDVLEDPDLEAAYDELEALDERLPTVLEVVTSMAKANDTGSLDIIISEIKVQFELIDSAFSKALQGSNGTREHEILDDIQSNIDDLKDNMLGSSGFAALKRNHLRAMSNLDAQFDSSSAKAAQVENVLDSLINMVNQRADTITDEVNDAISGSRFSTIVLVILSLLIGGVVSFFSVRAITTPLASVNELLKSVSSGDLRRNLKITSQDEFGELASNVNLLIDSLKEIISGISSSTGMLSEATDQTLNTIKETSEAVNGQKSQIDLVATATSQMSSTSSAVASNAKNTLEQIDQANSRAEVIKDIYKENLNSIVTLAQEIETTADVINKLNQDSVSIGTILEVIRDIADQTNLLALNAAIEAARAGEQGRGFAVVADEVRTLASRTQESTQKIHTMIQVLQNGADQAVSAMNTGREQARVSVEKTEQANTELTQITEAVNKAYLASVEIEQSAKEQSVVSNDISEKLENIVMLSEETADNANSTSQANERVVKLTQELQDSITNFRT